jgi:hypothetical protein
MWHQEKTKPHAGFLKQDPAQEIVKIKSSGVVVCIFFTICSTRSLDRFKSLTNLFNQSHPGCIQGFHLSGASVTVSSFFSGSRQGMESQESHWDCVILAKSRRNCFSQSMSSRQLFFQFFFLWTLRIETTTAPKAPSSPRQHLPATFWSSSRG